MSVSFCMILNLGMTTIMIAVIHASISTTATIVAQVSCMLVARILHIAQTAVMGAATTIRSIMMLATCTCWTSLVVRVIKDGVENLSTSAAEKESTFLYTAERMFVESPAET